jgi:hypothetical protein
MFIESKNEFSFIIWETHVHYLEINHYVILWALLITQVITRVIDYIEFLKIIDS